LRAALLQLSRGKAMRDRVARSLRALGSFVGAMKVKYSDLEFGVDLENERVWLTAAISSRSGRLFTE